MTALTDSERADMAARMLPVAARVACIVHGDGGAADIQHATQRLDRVELLGLIVALGALVDPDAQVADVLEFLTWDPEDQERLKRYAATERTIRSLVPASTVTPTQTERLWEHEQRLEARRLHLAHGMEPKEIGLRMALSERTIGRWKQEGWVKSA